MNFIYLVLKGCNGQDISRRGAKSKGSRIMVVLPFHLSFPKGAGEDNITIGQIEKANTDAPELVVDTKEVIPYFGYCFS